MNTVYSKRNFVERFQRNEFGNRGPVWDTLAEFLKSGYKGLIHIRCREAGGATYYDIPDKQVERVWSRVVDEPTRWYLAAMAPTPKTLFQGEVTVGTDGVCLLFTTVAKPMRDALADSCKQVQGIIAVSLLRYYLCPSSYDWLVELLDNYPGHVVEFSTYSTHWGTIPNRNTIFWEVRKY
jgi:hypothetical protein